MTPPEPVRVPPAAAATSRLRRNPATTARKVIESDQQDGWLLAVELVTATFTWGGVGYLIDRFWLHTYPVFMSIGFVVGFFAGMYLLWLKTSEPDTAAQESKGSGADDGA